MAEHTPEPWAIKKGRPFGPTIFMPDDTVEIIGGPTRGLIACLYARNWANNEDEANARLIAASPDLLKALEAMVDHFGVLEDNEMVHSTARAASKKARAAIAKTKEAAP